MQFDVLCVAMYSSPICHTEKPHPFTHGVPFEISLPLILPTLWCKLLLFVNIVHSTISYFGSLTFRYIHVHSIPSVNLMIVRAWFVTMVTFKSPVDFIMVVYIISTLTSIIKIVFSLYFHHVTYNCTFNVKMINS